MTHQMSHGIQKLTRRNCTRSCRIYMFSIHLVLLFCAVLVAHVGGLTPFPPLIKPKRILPHSTVALISPASPYSYLEPDVNSYLQNLTRYMRNTLDVAVLYAKHMNETFGYLAGPDADRADDVNSMFANSGVSWILANRGGYGTDRILDLLDYKTIKNNPKVIMGYSDMTALIHAIHIQTGLVTFYGPMGIDNWDNLNGHYVQSVSFSGERVLFQNPSGPNQTITTVHGGKARGKLLGGNLSVFVATLGSPFLPLDLPWEKVILFLEEVEEEPYHVDRMLTTLHLTGVLERVAGLVWGRCTDCVSVNPPSQTLTIQQVLSMRFSPLKVPCFTGALIGHIDEQFTLPLGIQVEIDADEGTIQMLESAVI